MNKWVEENYSRIKTICNKFNINIDTDDLCQSCIEQFLKNKRAKDIPDNKKIYFFTRIVMNNAASKSSNFYYENRNHKLVELFNVDIEDKIEEDIITLDWVKELIEKGKKEEWYYWRLMELYIEEGCSLTKLSKRTTIPLNSISRDIHKIKKILIKERNKKLQL